MKRLQRETWKSHSQNVVSVNIMLREPTRIVDLGPSHLVYLYPARDAAQTPNTEVVSPLQGMVHSIDAWKAEAEAWKAETDETVPLLPNTASSSPPKEAPAYKLTKLDTSATTTANNGNHLGSNCTNKPAREKVLHASNRRGRRLHRQTQQRMTSHDKAEEDGRHGSGGSSAGGI
jgi:hypothetical protein